MTKKYLLLYPDTFFWYTKDNGLIYNTKKGVSYFFRLTPCLLNICNKLQDPTNLYRCDISDLNDTLLDKWINQILKLRMGEICLLNENYSPISFPPILNLQSDVIRLENDPGRNIGENVLSYLTDINIYLGGICKVDNMYSRQFLYPISDEKIMHPNILKKFLLTLKNMQIKLNIIGGHLSDYPHFKELFELVNKCSFMLVFYVFDYAFMQLHKSLIGEVDIHIKIIITNIDSYKNISNFIDNEYKDRKCNLVYSWIFIASSKVDLANLSAVFSDNKCNKLEIYPVYTGDNHDFFVKNVYTSMSFLSKPKVDKKYIYRNSVINSNFWGKVTIMPDGKIYSNLNFTSIGTIFDTPYEILIRELKMMNSWRLLRENCIPCKKCLYKYICPPISNYELVIGKPNLCHIKP